MSKLNLYSLKHSSPNLLTPSDPEEQRRDELCLQLAENLLDLGACDFSREIQAGNNRFIIRVARA
jgi:hypothetical protein